MDSNYDKGLATRKQVMGEDFVARALGGDKLVDLIIHRSHKVWIVELWKAPLLFCIKVQR